MAPYSPTRTPNGVATAARNTFFGAFPRPNPFVVQKLVDEFLRYLATDWTVTAATGTVALTAGAGGRVLLSTTAANADIVAIQSPVKQWNLQNAVGPNAFWFLTNFQANVASASLYQAGFADTFATLNPTDGVYFEKPAAGTVLNLIINRGGVKTTVLISSAFPAATDMALGFFCDGMPTPTLYAFCSIPLATPTVNGQPYYTGGQIVASVGANGTTVVALGGALPLAATGLTVGLAVKAGSAAINTLNADYLFAACDIPTRF